MKAYGQELARLDLARRAGDAAALGGVRSVVLDNGSERGIRAVEFRTGTGLAFDVLVDRAMDIGRAEHAGQSFGWCSPTGFRHPSLHEYADEGGLSWLRSFSGLMVTGGLDHTLFTATVDADQYHYPHRQTVWNGLHGRVANIPATLVGAGADWQGDACTLWAQGEIRQAAVFGEDLRLRRRIEADLGGDEIRLLDTVTNNGFARTPHMFLYHVNLGWPLLDEGSRFVAPIDSTLWATDSVRAQKVSYRRMPAPSAGFVEQVYEHRLVAAPDGRVTVALVNDRLGLAVAIQWSLDQFPAFFEWLNLQEGAYALGVEPSTHHVNGELAARQDGSMIWLEHGQARQYATRFRVVRGEAAIRELVDEVAAVARQPEADVPAVAG